MREEPQRHLKGDTQEQREEEIIVCSCEGAHTRWKKDVQLLLC